MFVAAGMCLIPLPGLQSDEVLFGSAVYAPQTTRAWVTVFGKTLPIMLLSYLGALKTWLYAPILAEWPPSAWSIRVPVLLLGAITIWLFYRLLDRVCGRRAALLGCALLATDTTFLLTTCFDWGPVVLQRLLAVAGVLLLVRYHQDGSRLSLASAFFLFGLALWDKALFGWSLAGFLAGAVLVFPGAIGKAVRPWPLLLALACFCAGVFPLAWYNHRYPMETVRENVGWSTEIIGHKFTILGRTLAGSGLMGYLTYDDPADSPRRPRTGLERALVALDELAGRPHQGFLPYAMLGAVVAIPFCWRTRARAPVLFALVFLTVTWGLMLFTRGGGASVHHVSLVWPWPHFLVAVAAAELSTRFRRAGLAAVVLSGALFCGRALLVSNANLSQLVRNGARGSWSNAIYTTADYIESASPGEVVVLDWGLLESLQTLLRGRTKLVWGGERLRKSPSGSEDEEEIRTMVEPPHRIFLSFVDSQEQYPGVNERFRSILARIGATREILLVIRDSNGRPVHELSRIRLP